MISLQDGLRGLKMLREVGCDKMNFAGGEPFLHPRELGELCRGAHELGMAVSIISNASVIRRYADMSGVRGRVAGIRLGKSRDRGLKL